MMQESRESYQLRNNVRFVTAASLFDGHDASINIIRRLLQAKGVEVVHLGHNRSVREIASAAIQEDVQAVAVSSYQGGHNEFFHYLVDRLKDNGCGHIRIFGGGGGVIVPKEIRELESYGVTRIYSPEDGRRMGLSGMIDDMLRSSDFALPPIQAAELGRVEPGSTGRIARLLTQAEMNGASPVSLDAIVNASARKRKAPVVGITGTGGAGKSSLTDELVRRLVTDAPELPIAILSIDPTKKKTGGALLGDRIRMNAIDRPNVFMRSLATRGSGSELSHATLAGIAILEAAGFRVILVETSGIGQGSSAIADVADVSLYVMTPEYGASSQLEKIDMLDFADLVAINKFDRRGAEDALRDVRKQFRRGRQIAHDVLDSELPVFGTIASQFGDQGVTALYLELVSRLRDKDSSLPESRLSGRGVAEARVGVRKSPIPEQRARYLGDIVELVRKEEERISAEVTVARKLFQLEGALSEVDDEKAAAVIRARFRELRQEIRDESMALVDQWPELKKRYSRETVSFGVRGREISVETTTTTLSGSRIPKIALPSFEDWGEILRFRSKENLPGYYPYTAGVFPFKRAEEAPRRQFAGEGGPRRTNRRFHFLCRNDTAKRLSTAFDSVTLYGEDPDERPDIYGKIGEGGVSIATLEDMKELYAGFDLTDPLTSVSMTINGPAPTVLAMFFNTAIDRELERFEKSEGRKPDEEETRRIRRETLSVVRGTVQADILKEDQAQNTCIFSTDFALRLMGDVQRYFIDHSVRNFYSVSISGYHIAEAGANPITQLAFTLANGFTYVEYYLARGMVIDEFALNLSFFFSNGLDPEYSVLGRVARRIWARVMKNRYGASERSQKFKYHIQTSGRSLHAREIQFNDIRTTLQALTAIYDNCNSLHTNAYDEAITTPTTESVRRAMAIQQIIQKEFGVTRNENPLQGSYLVEELTDLVEEAVLVEFDRINQRGGVLGAMELQYQRGRIQEESLHYELKKDSGELPIVGVNCFVDAEEERESNGEIELARATPEEKQDQIRRLRAFQKLHESEAPAALERLKQSALEENGNVFAELMESVRVASLGQITQALYDVGGRYRRAL